MPTQSYLEASHQLVTAGLAVRCSCGWSVANGSGESAEVVHAHHLGEVAAEESEPAIAVRNGEAPYAFGGRPFLVRVEPSRSDHESDEEVVAFYDLDVVGRPEFGLHGQFVSRYAISTFLGEDEFSYGSPEDGLALDCGIEAWSVDGPAMRRAIAFVRGARR